MIDPHHWHGLQGLPLIAGIMQGISRLPQWVFRFAAFFSASGLGGYTALQVGQVRQEERVNAIVATVSDWKMSQIRSEDRQREAIDRLIVQVAALQAALARHEGESNGRRRNGEQGP